MKSFQTACRASAPSVSNERYPENSQDSSGVKSRICFSRSTTSLVATLCTRPALSPEATFFQRIGETRYPTIRSTIRRACCASTRGMLILRGFSKARCTSDLVIASKVTRFACFGSTFNSSARCQAMASPSRSRSVANQISRAPFASLRSSVTVFFFAESTSYVGSKLCSRSTPGTSCLIPLGARLGRSRMCPTDAFTTNPRPRYFSMVFAFAGLSTITSS